ncbi:14140_t:CDS:2, partial [Dentiscutata erythropus]
MVKLELLSVLVVLLLSINYSSGATLYEAPTSIGNYEYPYDVYIPSNFTIPDKNVYKFKLYSAALVWYKCNSTSSKKWGIVYFNKKEDRFFYPSSVVAALNSRNGEERVISAIPKYDNSTMTVTVIGTAPSSNPTEDYFNELLAVKNTTGRGAFSDLTYFILTDVKGGVAPPNTECGTTYPDGYIYSVSLTATLLYFHPGPK